MEVRNNPVKDENDTITNYINAPVAQLDRVLVSETKGHRFESCRARHSLLKEGTDVAEVFGFNTDTL